MFFKISLPLKRTGAKSAGKRSCSWHRDSDIDVDIIDLDTVGANITDTDEERILRLFSIAKFLN
jgi:hypothetical protein